MPRSYYIFSSGRLRRKGNTLYLEKAEKDPHEDADDLSSLAEFTDDDQLAGPMTLTGEGQPDASSPMEADDPLQNTIPLSPSLESTVEESPPEPAATPPAKSSAATLDRPRPIPVEDVEDLFLFGEILLNTKLLNFLGQKGIPAHTFNYYGFYTGSYFPRQRQVSGHLLVKQVEHYLDPTKRLVLAKEIVRGAYHNLHRNLLYYRNRGKEVEAAIQALEAEAAQIESADSVAALMGAEGRMRQYYYRAFNVILDLEVPFLKRVKRPPDNLLNALISFGNSLLYAAVLSQIYRTPLNPTVSFLHEPGTRRFSLALDIAEIFKPLIVDKIIFKLINKQMITEADFMKEVAFAYLKDNARKLVVQQFEERLQTTVKHRRLARHVSYRGFIRLECYKLVRHLIFDEPYQALRAWW